MRFSMTWLSATADYKKLLLFLALTILCNIGIYFAMNDAMRIAGALDVAGFYTPEEAYKILGNLGQEGRDRYLIIETTIDMIYPVFYSLFFMFWIVIAWRGIPLKYNIPGWFVFIPLLAAVFDYLENGGAIFLIIQFPEIFTTIALITSFFSAAKWVLVFTALLLCITGSTVSLMKKQLKDL